MLKFYYCHVNMFFMDSYPLKLSVPMGPSLETVPEV